MGHSTWLVTGGLGFIGSHFIRLVLAERPDVRIVNLDVMNYAANLENLADVDGASRYAFVRGDICDRSDVATAIGRGVDAIVNFAAETHVDRSIIEPAAFLKTDILGTHVLLEAARSHDVGRFLQVSTDEVYGHVPEGVSREGDAIVPRSPYAASKAGGDLQALAYGTTYGTPVVVTRGSNTFGSHQFPEKFIPLFITNLLDDLPVPLYGDGLQVRDWMHVEDHARGILHVLEHGENGHVYNLGGGNERTNGDIARRLIALCGRDESTHLRHVADRPGHDRRYALCTDKAAALGWETRHSFEQALESTVQWYRSNASWWRPIRSGTFSEYYRRQYPALH